MEALLQQLCVELGVVAAVEGEEATALVEALIRIEEKDVVMLKKMLAMNYF